MFRTCNKLDCKQINPQPLENFYKGENYKGGRMPCCKQCKDLINRNYAIENPEKVATYKKKWSDNNPELNKILKQQWLNNNIELRKQISSSYTKNNLDKHCANQAKRRAAILQRTPKWLIELDWEKIEEFYFFSNLMTETLNIQHEVDHIIPLQGKYISGLHCPENLQILTASKNSSKGNRY